MDEEKHRVHQDKKIPIGLKGNTFMKSSRTGSYIHVQSERWGCLVDKNVRVDKWSD